MTLTARDRYNRGLPFERPAVLKMKRGWIALGPSLPYMGFRTNDWEEAFRVANYHAIVY